MVSIHSDDFPVDAEKEWARYLQFGETRMKAGDWIRADEEFSKALALDSTFGELHYRIGLLRLEEGRTAEASAAFSKALLHDALHLRACDPLVQVVRDLCASRREEGIFLVDAVRFEHVHPNGKGHYLIASEIYRTLLGSDVGEDLSPAGELPFEEASRRTGYTPVDRAYASNFMRIMLRQWPFTGTYHNQQARQRVEEDLNLARAELDSVQTAVFDTHPPGGTVLHLHHKLGVAYLDAGLPSEGAREFEIITRMLPGLTDVRLLLARALIESGELEEAGRSLRRAIAQGVLDREKISAAEGLDPLKNDPQFADLFQ